MNLPTHRRFVLPAQLSMDAQVSLCVRVIEQYRQELPHLRRATTILKRQKQNAHDEIAQWKQKYQEEKDRRERLEKENERLQKEIEKLTKTTNRYRASLFDHGNFKAPVEEAKKSKGGQVGHANTNREASEDSSLYARDRVFLRHCPSCGHRVHRVNAVQKKTLIDIVLNPQIVKLIIESERQWCCACTKEVSATDDRSIPFTEYGINTFMMAMLLRYRCLLSLTKITTVFQIGYGLNISESGLVSLFRQAHHFLGSRYEELKAIVRRGEVLYADETGWRVRGKGAWMWIMANSKATVYVAAEGRGKGIAEELYGNSCAYAMHDGLASYTNAVPRDKHLFCWAHMLRFCFEETINKSAGHESIHIRDTLVSIYHLKKDPYYQNNPKHLEQEAGRQIDHLLLYPSVDTTAQRLQHRLREQRDGLIRALIVSPNGTNNFAEQELRPIALSRRISYGSDTYTGMETTAALSSVIQTLVRTKQDEFFSTLHAYLRIGIANS